MQKQTQKASLNNPLLEIAKSPSTFLPIPRKAEDLPRFDETQASLLEATDCASKLLPLPRKAKDLPIFDETQASLLEATDCASKLLPIPRKAKDLPMFDETQASLLEATDCASKLLPPTCTKVETSLQNAKNGNSTPEADLPKPTLAFQIATWLAEESGFAFAVDKQANLCVYEVDFGYFRAFKSHRDFENFLNNTIPVAFLAATTRNTQFEVERFLRSCRRFSTPLDEPPAGMVNLRNGVFDIQRQILLPHSKTYGFTFFVDANYLLDSNMNSVSENYFVHLGVTNKGRDDLLAVLGISISNFRNLQKSAFIYGPGGNGKSIFANLVRHLLPHTQVAGLNFADLANPFAPANLDGKLVSISSDETAKQPNPKALAVFKKIVGQDFFEVQRKNVQHTTIRPNCFLIFVSNYRFQIRKSDDPNGGVKRRVWLISTGDRVDSSTIDLQLEDKLLADRDAIVSESLRIASWYLRNWQELMPEPSLDEIYLEDTSDNTGVDAFIAAFVEKYLSPDNGASVAVKDVFQKFCQLNPDVAKLSGLKLNGFAARLKKAIPNSFFAKRNGSSTLLGFKFSYNTEEFAF